MGSKHVQVFQHAIITMDSPLTQLIAYVSERSQTLYDACLRSVLWQYDAVRGGMLADCCRKPGRDPGFTR